MKKIIVFYIVCILLAILIPINNEDVLASEEQIWENEYGKMVVWPMEASGLIEFTQYCNITWYKPSNVLDVAFRFNDSLNSGKVWYWNNNQWNEVSFSHSVYAGKHYYIHTGFNVEQDHTYHFKWTYNPKQGMGKWDFIAKLNSDSWSTAYSTGRYILLDPWWDTDWAYYRHFSVNPSYVDNDIVNMPIMVEIPLDIVNDCQGYGHDIRIVDDSNSTLLPFEIESWSLGFGGYIWVNISKDCGGLSSSSYTNFNVYYGNPSCPSGENKTDVWDSDYITVLHFNESSGNAIDSSNNGLDFTAHEVDYSYTGISGNCFNYERDDVSTNYLSVNDVGITTGTYTFEIWVCPESLNNWMETHINPGSTLTIYSDGDFWARGGITCTDCYYFAPTHWYYISQGRTAGGTIDLILNTTNAGTDTGSYSLTSSCKIGSDDALNYDYDGLIDEFRISKVFRNTTFRKIVYSNLVESDFIVWGSTQTLTIQAPGDFTATWKNGQMELTWVNDDEATSTYIERNTVSSWVIGSGTNIYNSTGTIFNDAYNFVEGTKYYYQGWSYNSTGDEWSGYNSSSNISAPGNPTLSDVTLWPGNNLNITWSNHSYSDNTVLVRKQGVFPSSPTDGTVLYNGTLEYYNDTGVSTDYFYTLFSWNNTVKEHSSGVHAQWGSFTIRCFDEVTGNPIASWNVFISNQDGTVTYTNNSASNPLIIDVNDLPYGDDTIIILNATGYINRSFYMDIVLNQQYSLDAYLTEITGSVLYQLQILGPPSDYGYDPPVEGAKVKITRYINSSVGYQTIGSLLSDANGYCYIEVTPNINYIVNISKTGYITSVGSWTPLTSVLYYSFRIYPLDVTYKEWDLWSQNITFTATMVDAGYMQLGNITITYNDVNSSTVDTNMYLYELYNGTVTLLGSNSSAGNSWTFTNSSINTTRVHRVVLYFNNTADFSDISSPYSITIANIHNWRGDRTKFSFHDRVVSLIGVFTINGVTIQYSSLIALIAAFSMLVLLSPYHAPLALIGSGLTLSMVQGIFSLWFNDTFPILLPLLTGLLVFIGILAWISMKNAEETI